MPVASGISELDAVLGGGFPLGRTTVITGGPGSGKTMLGMQFLAAGVANGEAGIMLSFEESREKLVSNFATMSFPFAAELGKAIEIIDGRPTTDTTTIGNFDFTGLIATLSAITRERGTRRLVIDAIDCIIALGGERYETRREIMRLLSWLQDAGITTLLTLKTANATAGLPQVFDFAEFAADGVIQLRTNMQGILLRRALRVVKIRGVGFATGDHPYVIDQNGVRILYRSIHTHANDSSGFERCSTGIGRLDTMLEGGYLRGSVALISGLPGTAKTTFASAFLAAGCARGERCLFVGFDEPAEQIVMDVQSVGIDLHEPMRQGLLRVESFAAGSGIDDRVILMIEDLIKEFQPKCIVLDPISAWSKSEGADNTDVAIERIVSTIKERGLTAVLTAISEHGESMLESTQARVSTVADTWIHLSYASQGGERVRTLTVVKSRGTEHSAQMREVTLSKSGLSLADVYEGEGEVLFGTARYEREQELLTLISEKERKMAHAAREIDDQRSNLAAQLERLSERRIEMLTKFEREIEADRAQAKQIGTLRGADDDVSST